MTLTNAAVRRINRLASQINLLTIGSVATACLMWVWPVAARAQTAPATPKAFEVASVRPVQPPYLPAHLFIRQNRVDIKWRLSGITAAAYNIQPYQLAGLPAWAESAWYQIEATPPVPVSDSELKLMLRALLASRFQLKVEATTDKVPGYRLVVAPGGVKNLASTPAPVWQDGRIVANAGSMTAKEFAQSLHADGSGFWVPAVGADHTRTALSKASMCGSGANV